MSTDRAPAGRRQFGRPMLSRDDPGLVLLLDRAGGVSALARHLGVSAQAVALWKQVPERYVVQLAVDFRLGRGRLRADLYDKKGRRRAQPASGPAPAASPAP